MPVPRDFDIGRPSSSFTHPFFMTRRYGARPLIATAVISELRNQPRILVAALEHEVRRPRHSLASEHREMRHAGLEPDVDDVLLFLEPSAAARRTREVRQADTSQPGRSTIRRRPSAANRFAAIRATRASSSGLAARKAGHRRNRRAPRALPREAPLGMRLDHLALALASPFRNVVDRVGRVDRALAQHVLIHRDKPLRGRAEDHGIVTTPAVRIRVLVLARAPERAGGAKIVDDLRVRVEDLQSGVRTRFGREPARSRRPG